MTVHRVRHRHPLGALLYAVRDRGLAALEEPVNAARLERLDEATRAQLNKRIAEIFRERQQQPGLAPVPLDFCG